MLGHHALSEPHPKTPGPTSPPCPRYELHSEFQEALEHAQDRGKNTKVSACKHGGWAT